MEMLNILHIAMTDLTKEGAAAMIKPRIRKSYFYAHIWVCYTKALRGYGFTPKDAYADWKKYSC